MRRKKGLSSYWWLFLLLSATLTAIPFGIILMSFSSSDAVIWQHLWHYQLPELIQNTLTLASLVGLGVFFIGTLLGWLVAVHDFPLRRWFEWILVLPLAVPAYVMAFAQLGLFDFTGFIQTSLRESLGRDVNNWFPIRSTWGVAWVMTLSYYPYVYLLARHAFRSMGQRALEVGQSLGYSPWQSFWRVALPLARPWLAGGVTLAIMETLADFGAVSIFNFDTFTTAIYKAWFALFSLATAQQLASILVLLVILMVFAERKTRGQRRYAVKDAVESLKRRTLPKFWAYAATFLAMLVFIFAFILPVGQLLIWALPRLATDLNLEFGTYIRGSAVLSMMAAFVIVISALITGFARRRSLQSWGNPMVQVATAGYAFPGSVLAVGVFVPIAWLDNWLLGDASATLFKGSLWAMMWAYWVRFLAVGFSPVDSAMQRITHSKEEAAYSLGVAGWRLLTRLYAPMVSGGLLTALLMVFIDVMKEMPITLMMRPFGWDTLAVRIFSLTSEGLWQQAALPALALVLVGLIPVLLLSFQKHQ